MTRKKVYKYIFTLELRSETISKVNDARKLIRDCLKDLNCKLISTKKNQSISPRSGKNKGAKLQQWVGKKISELVDLPFGKDEPIESRPMGQSGVDIRLDDRALELFPWAIECKWQESWNVPDFIRQAKNGRRDRYEDCDWILFMKKSKESPVAVMSGTAFFNLLANQRK